MRSTPAEPRGTRQGRSRCDHRAVRKKQPASRRENIPEITSFRLVHRINRIGPEPNPHNPRVPWVKGMTAVTTLFSRRRAEPNSAARMNDIHPADGEFATLRKHRRNHRNDGRSTDFTTPSMLSIDTGHTQMSRRLNQGTSRQKHRNPDRNNEPDSTPEPAGHHTSDSGVMD